jgi:tripartite-type tricarboxylate transporter receptor subunit TctC
MVSKSRRTQRRLVEARLQGHPLRVKATKLPRRQFLRLAAGATVVSQIASAQTAYPSRPVRVIVPFAAGGTADILERHLAQRLSVRMGHQVIVENKPVGAPTLASSR